MNTKLTRRAALALPFAVPAIGALDALAASPVPEPDSAALPGPEPVIIDGLNQITTVVGIFMVDTADGRHAIFKIVLGADEDGVQVVHLVDDEKLHAHVPVDAYATLPVWLQRELGGAALAATKGGAK